MATFYKKCVSSRLHKFPVSGGRSKPDPISLVCHGLRGKQICRERHGITGLPRPGKNQGKSQFFKVREKSRKFYLKVAANCFMRFFRLDRAFFLIIYKPSLFLIHGRNDHPAGSVIIALQSMLSTGNVREFFYSGE